MESFNVSPSKRSIGVESPNKNEKITQKSSVDEVAEWLKKNQLDFVIVCYYFVSIT
jgi:hypothetical protein